MLAIERAARTGPFTLTVSCQAARELPKQRRY